MVRYLFSVPSSPAKAKCAQWGEERASKASPPPCLGRDPAQLHRAPLLAGLLDTALLLLSRVGSHRTVTGRSCSSCVSKAMRSLWTSCRRRGVSELLGCTTLLQERAARQALRSSQGRAACQCGSWAGVQLLQGLPLPLGRLRAPEWEWVHLNAPKPQCKMCLRSAHQVFWSP